MIRSILADRVNNDILSLERILTIDFPDIYICGKAYDISTTSNLVNRFNPELVFINVELPLNNGFTLNDYFSNISYEIIFLAETDNYVVEAIQALGMVYGTAFISIR